jgi:hypothetical protein
MFWGNVIRPVAVMAATLIGTAAIAGPIVVRATGPSAKLYTPGRQLADDAQIALKAGDRLVLVDSRGTRTLAGPGTFAATGSSARMGLSATAARFIATQRAQERRGGAVRGSGEASAAKTSPNLWFLVPGTSGTHCLIDPAALKLWRAATDQPATIDIRGTQAAGQVAMPVGRSTADWPAALPIADNSEYTLSGPGTVATKVRFAVIAADPDKLDDVTGKLIARGCNAQVDLLVKVLTPIGSGSGS